MDIGYKTIRLVDIKIEKRTTICEKTGKVTFLINRFKIYILPSSFAQNQFSITINITFIFITIYL